MLNVEILRIFIWVWERNRKCHFSLLLLNMIVEGLNSKMRQLKNKRIVDQKNIKLSSSENDKRRPKNPSKVTNKSCRFRHKVNMQQSNENPYHQELRNRTDKMPGKIRARARRKLSQIQKCNRFVNTQLLFSYSLWWVFFCVTKILGILFVFRDFKYLLLKCG